MEVEVLREKLHDYINIADEQHLSAIYVLVGDSLPVDDEEVFDRETMEKIYKRMADHRNGTSKSYTVEESMDLIKQYKK